MTTEPTRRVNIFHVALGLCWMTLGVLLLMERGGAIEMEQIVQYWPLALVLLGGAVVWQASRGDVVRDIPWGAFVWVIILGMLFSHVAERRSDVGGDDLGTFAMLNRGHAAPEGPLRGGHVTTFLAGTDIDLRGATLEPGQTASIDVFNMLGGTNIRVPADWIVDFRTTVVLGGVNDERGRRNVETQQPEGASASFDEAAEAAASAPQVQADTAPQPAPRLIVSGVVVLGGVSVKR